MQLRAFRAIVYGYLYSFWPILMGKFSVFSIADLVTRSVTRSALVRSCMYLPTIALPWHYLRMSVCTGAIWFLHALRISVCTGTVQTLHYVRCTKCTSQMFPFPDVCSSSVTKSGDGKWVQHRKSRIRSSFIFLDCWSTRPFPLNPPRVGGTRRKPSYKT